MYQDRYKAQAIKEQQELEKQINDLISDFEKRWTNRWQPVKLIPISEIKNNLPYIAQKGGRIQLFLNT